MAEKPVVFSFGNRLPLLSDVMRCILTIYPNRTAKQDHLINNAVETFCEIWERVFPAHYLITRRAMIGRLQRKADVYHNRFMTNKNKRPSGSDKSEFYGKLDHLLDVLSPAVEIEDEKLKEFHDDQKGPRNMYIHNDQIMFGGEEDEIHGYFYLGIQFTQNH
jgi:hypothetical protein